MRHSNRYVLFADDDKDDIVLMEEAFRRTSIKEKLISVRNGNDVLNHLHENQDNWPQLILLDLNMPGKGGRDTLIALKQHRSLKTIPVVIYSTANDQKQIKECYELGANSYVVKPAAFDKLIYTVEMIHGYWCKTASVAF